MRFISDKRISGFAIVSSVIFHVILVIGASFFSLNVSDAGSKEEKKSVTIHIENIPSHSHMDNEINEEKPREIPKETSPEPEPVEKKKEIIEEIVEVEIPDIENFYTEQSGPVQVPDKKEPITEEEIPKPIEAIGEHQPEDSNKDVSSENHQAYTNESDETNNLYDEILSRLTSIIKETIESNRRYPNWARRQGFEGTSHVEFILLPDGTVKDITLVKSSGFNILDKEALATIERAAPFLPIPDRLNEPYLKMEIALLFDLN